MGHLHQGAVSESQVQAYLLVVQEDFLTLGWDFSIYKAFSLPSTSSLPPWQVPQFLTVAEAVRTPISKEHHCLTVCGAQNLTTLPTIPHPNSSQPMTDRSWFL